MGDDETGPVFHQRAHRLLNLHFRPGINTARCLIQNKNGGIGEDGPSDRQQLPLSLAQIASARNNGVS